MRQSTTYVDISMHARAELKDLSRAVPIAISQYRQPATSSDARLHRGIALIDPCFDFTMTIWEYGVEFVHNTVRSTVTSTSARDTAAHPPPRRSARAVDPALRPPPRAPRGPAPLRHRAATPRPPSARPSTGSAGQPRAALSHPSTPTVTVTVTATRTLTCRPTPAPPPRAAASRASPDRAPAPSAADPQNGCVGARPRSRAGCASTNTSLCAAPAPLPAAPRAPRMVPPSTAGIRRCSPSTGLPPPWSLQPPQPQPPTRGRQYQVGP
jgi:hypothetical protein